MTAVCEDCGLPFGMASDRCQSALDLTGSMLCRGRTIARLRRENASLRAVVEAADALRAHPGIGMDGDWEDFDSARAEWAKLEKA